MFLENRLARALELNIWYFWPGSQFCSLDGHLLNVATYLMF